MTKTEAAALRHREAIAAGASATGRAISNGATTVGTYLKVLFVGAKTEAPAPVVRKPTAKRTARGVKKTNARSAGK